MLQHPDTSSSHVISGEPVAEVCIHTVMVTKTLDQKYSSMERGEADEKFR